MVTVIGLGNVLLGDEGFGVHLVRRLARRGIAGLELVDGGCAGINLVPFLRTREAVLLVDVILAPDHPPGSLLVLDWEEIEALAPGRLVSAHQIGVREALGLSRLLGARPAYFRALAAVPERIAPGLKLTPALAAALERAEEWVVREAERRGGGCVSACP